MKELDWTPIKDAVFDVGRAYLYVDAKTPTKLIAAAPGRKRLRTPYTSTHAMLLPALPPIAAPVEAAPPSTTPTAVQIRDALALLQSVCAA